MQTPSIGPVASAAATPQDAAVRAQLEKAALQFEGMFIQQMLKSMRQSSGALGGDNALLRQDVDDPLLGYADQLLADNLSGQRAFGIADMLLRQLLPAEPLKPVASAAALPEQMQSSTNPPKAQP
jgi:flagellar protein FlgJ